MSLLAPLGVRTPMLGDAESPFARNAPVRSRSRKRSRDMVVDAIDAERFLILTDPIAQKWMNNKNADLERWLNGMRRLQKTLEAGR